MLTNPAALRVLCYGDSNTFGCPSEEVGLRRWPVDVRWTGQLQTLLGAGYDVIEEGMGGRTTAVDHADPDRPGRNGLNYLLPCVRSHNPLDVVVVMLGTNDVKIEFRQSPAEIASALDRYVDVIETEAASQDGGPPAVLLISPTPVDDTRPDFARVCGDLYDSTSAAASRRIAEQLRAVASRRGVAYADAASVASVGGDGVHLARDAHRALAALLAEEIRALSAARTRARIGH
ncbi:MAG: GDSL-type esterase/lipase family protein [Micromonosporaceae bacterium]